MLLTRSKGSNVATNVDELKKQASAAAVAKAVEVIKAGGTQAEAAAAAKGVARDILAKGQQQMLQKPPVSNKKGGKGLMGKLRKNKNKKRESNNAAASNKPMKSPAATALPSTTTLKRTGTISPDPESITSGSRTDSRSESSGDAASSYSSSSGRVTEDDGTAPSKTSSKESSTSSKPSLYLDESLAGTNEEMSYITDGNTSRSTIHITDMLNMGNVMNAIDTALEEKDIEREMRGGKKHWIDRILDCDMCLGPDGSDNDNSFISSGSGDGTILSKDAPSVLSASGRERNNGGGGDNNGLETVEEEKDSSDSVSADKGTNAKDSPPSSSDTQAKLDQSGSTKKTSDASTLGTLALASGAQTQLRSSSSKSPATVDSKGNSTKSGGEDDSLSLNPVVPTPWKQFLGIGQGAAPSPAPNNKESTQATQPKPVVEKQQQQQQQQHQVPQQQQMQQQQGQQQQQQPEERQDENVDWRSQVTDEAPNPNPKLASRAATYDPKKSNPSVFIPPTAQPTPQAEFINFGATGYGSPMNGQGYGYGGSPGSPQNYYPQRPSSPYGVNPASPYGQFQQGTNNISSTIQGVNTLSLDEASAHSRMDRYGGDEDVMISHAAAKSKSQLEGAASFVYRVLSGSNGDDAATVSTHGHEQQKYKQEQQYGQYGVPPPMHHYPPHPQQYHGGYSPHHQQQFPPQQQYQQHYQQQYPPQEQYQQLNYPTQQYPPTNIDPNPSSAAYYDQVQVSSPMHNPRFAA